jgi:hypothetical protein
MNKLWRNIALCLLIITLFIMPISALENETKDDESAVTTITGEDDWYYLPGYPNYCPNGLPDFHQRQQNDWKGNNGWSHCATTAVADILWWFDSKHENPEGAPGDGRDDYPLVKDYHAPGNPDPGPLSDDHNFNNVNDGGTPWHGDNTGELIERVGWYLNTNECRYSIPFMDTTGTFIFSLPWGVRKWIRDAGLQNDYRVEHLFIPDFSTIDERVRKNQGVELFLIWYDVDTKEIFFGHGVAVAGINSEGYIAFSDPDIDIANPQPERKAYNNASIVSHDVYEIDFDCPHPLATWWIPGYANYKDGALILSATIISETN